MPQNCSANSRRSLSCIVCSSSKSAEPQVELRGSGIALGCMAQEFIAEVALFILSNGLPTKAYHSIPPQCQFSLPGFIFYLRSAPFNQPNNAMQRLQLPKLEAMLTSVIKAHISSETYFPSPPPPRPLCLYN